MHFHLILSLIFTVILSVLGQDNRNHEEHRVNIAVYYESLCPDSRKFFTQQLYPSLQGNLSKFVNLTLVPYGKTKMRFDVNNYVFECHHGPNECQGNKLQACAIKLIDNSSNSEGLGFNKVTTGFINCLMDKADKEKGYFPTRECAQINNVNNLILIENCANHTDGSNFLANLGKLTESVQNPLTGVPTIVFNKQYQKADSDLAQTNFVKALCQYIHGPKPEECTRNGGISMGISLSILMYSFLLITFLK